MDFRDVTLAYDDDTKGYIGTWDVTLAYDDDTKGITMTMFQLQIQ